ncbi:MAG: protein BatD [Oceanicaulis sp.]|nr:protein BatD [Oceanicaulis sp.]
MRAAIVAAVMVLAATAVPAQETSIEVSLDPPKLGLEDLARFTVRVSEPRGETPRVDLTNLDGFRVVQGPSSEQQFSWVNGRSSSAVILTWTLKPERVGQTSVGPVTVRVGSATISTERVTAEVVTGSVAPPRRRPANPFTADPFRSPLETAARPQRQPTVELRHLVERRSLMVGEPMVATVVLDTTVGVDGFEWDVTPEYPGFWVQRVEAPPQIETEQVEIDGVPMLRAILARSVIVPLKPGTIEIPEVAVRVGFRSRSLFARPQVVRRAAGPLAVSATAVPAGPASATGAVGKLSYTVELEPAQITFGESAVMTVTVEGSGNLPLLQAPTAWPSHPDCETYPPEEASEIVTDRRGLSGSRTWRTTVLPRRHGTLEFSPVEVSVFDPRSGDYRTQTLGPLVLEVLPPPPTPTPEPDPGAEAADEATASEGPASVGMGLLVGVALGALLVGCGIGAAAVWAAQRRSASALPPRREGESPSDRARRLQVALEGWWQTVEHPSDELRGTVDAARRELEGIRFAPGRADHTESIGALEERLRRLMRRR